MYHLSPTAQWDPAYEAILERIAATDIIGPETEWSQLREMIKFKLEQNIVVFLSDAEQHTDVSNGSPRLATGIPDSSGNLRLPPFPPRKPNELNPIEAPKVHMNEEEANELKNLIFKQLHEFDENPPFTIQRVCELCVNPKKTVQGHRQISPCCREVPPCHIDMEFLPARDAAKWSFSRKHVS